MTTKKIFFFFWFSIFKGKVFEGGHAFIWDRVDGYIYFIVLYVHTTWYVYTVTYQSYLKVKIKRMLPYFYGIVHLRK